MEEVEFFLKLRTSDFSEVGIGSSYNELISSFNFNIVLEESDDDYQGDTFVLLKVSSYYGFLRFGWGSCSGCDALQGCGSKKDVEELRDRLFEQMVWKSSLEEMKEYLNPNRKPEDMDPWYEYSRTFKHFKEKVLEL